MVLYSMDKQLFYSTLWAKLLAHNRKFDLLRSRDGVLVGVSGGPDSVCLAHFLERLSHRIPLRLHVLHLHHGLRGRRADRDAQVASRLAEKLHIPFTFQKIPVARFARSSGRSLEDAARTLRYRAFGAAARRFGLNKIATAHQMDDQAETLILNLMRGTRAKGLAGIAVRRDLRKPRCADMRIGAAQRTGRPAALRQENVSVEVVRPLLCLTRREVMSYVKHHRLRYAVDETNNSTRFTRNWIRRNVIPLLEKRNPKIQEHLGAVAQDMRRILHVSASDLF